MFTVKPSESRRRFLNILGYSAVSAALGLNVNRTATASVLATAPADTQTSLPASLRAIGEEYLGKHPAERSKKVLLQAIRSHPGWPPGSTAAPTEAQLNQLIVADFQADEVVYLQGWALSRTEARLAALSII